MSLHRFAAAILFAALVCAGLSGRSSAQIPDTFTNLKVLPKDIKKAELVAMMRGFSMALNVRCIHCHKGDDPTDLSKVDFASDDKENKLIARAMIGMTQGINASLASDIAAHRPKPLEVTCFTCHHGNRRPETLEYTLATELNAHGVDSTLTMYRRLRNQYYGHATYDFSEWSLITIAENLSRDPKHTDAALAFLNENLVYYTDSAGTHARLGETYLAKGDTTAAMSSFEKALSLAPDDPWLKRRVERLKAKP